MNHIVGGIPAPNSGYECPIKKVTGNANIHIENDVGTEEQNLLLTLGDIELYALGNIAQDYFFKNTINSKYYNSQLELNSWYIHKEAESKIFNGNENYWQVISNKFYGLNKSNITNCDIPAYNTSNYRCNYFRRGTSTASVNQMYVGTNYINFNYDNNLAGLQNFKNKVAEWYNSGHPLQLVYKLLNPTNTKITDTTLISQLEAVINSKSFEGDTAITSTSDEEGFDMSVVAIGDINRVINNLLNN